MSYRHPDTIGIIDMHGTVYEIDWPHQIDDETIREDYGVVYLNGEMVGEFYPCKPDIFEATYEEAEDQS